MSAFRSVTLSAPLTRVLAGAGHGWLPVSDRRSRKGRGSRAPQSYELRVLGPVSLVDRHGRNILSLASQPRRIALLTYLALGTTDGLECRRRLARMFWPDRDLEAAEAAVDRAMFAIRRSLTRSTVVGDDERVGIARDRFRTDVERLRSAAKHGDRAAVNRLARGRLLADVHLPGLAEFNAWLAGQRAGLVQDLGARSA